jgi:hypothetical protein
MGHIKPTGRAWAIPMLQVLQSCSAGFCATHLLHIDIIITEWDRTGLENQDYGREDPLR